MESKHPIPKHPIRVLHVLEDFSSTNTGVTSVVRQMVGWQAEHCEWVGVYAVGSLDLPNPEGVHVKSETLNSAFYSWRYPRFGSKSLSRFVVEHRVDVLHLHGLWRAMPILGAWVAKKFGLPTVLSVHGQTAPWALDGQGALKKIKKILYWQLLGKKGLRDVSALHAITPLEKNNLYDFFQRQDATIIPNAIDLNSNSLSMDFRKRRHDFVFLGRLHPVKGVDLLIEAFSKAKLPDEGWRLLIAGPEEVPEYFAELRKLVSQSKRRERIHFLGPLHGTEKQELLRDSWAMVAPSYSEVIGMVNLEAAEQMLPSITTHSTGLTDWEEGGGVLISNGINELIEALESVASWSDVERIRRGCSSFNLVRDRYALEAVGPLWIDLYTKIMKGCTHGN